MSNEFVVKKGLILNNQAPVKFTDASGTLYVAVQAPSAVNSGNVNLTLPGSYGTSGQILATNSSGTLSWVTPASITSGSVTSGYIGDNAVLSGSIGSGQINKFHIASGQVVKGLTQGSNVSITVDANDVYTISATISGSVAVEPLTISSGLSLNSGTIYNGSVAMTLGISSGGIISNLIADNAITSSKIASGQIGAYQIASGVIPTSFSLTSGIVQSGNIGNNAVNSGNIASGSIGTFHISQGAITDGLIASGAITSGMIGAGAVFNNNIASGGVVSGKLADGSVVSGSIASGQISTYHFNSGAIINNALTLNDIISDRYAEQLKTGLLYGGSLSYISGTTTISISSGLGVIATPRIGSSGNPGITYVNWGLQSGLSIPISSGQITYVSIRSGGTYVTQNDEVTVNEYLDQIILGYVVHPTGVSIDSTETHPTLAYDCVTQVTQFARIFGPLKISGLSIAPNGANLQINRAAGYSFLFGANYLVDPNNPSVTTESSKSIAEITYIYRSAAAGQYTIVSPAVTNVNPTSWDDGDGTLGTVTTNQWTIQRVFYVPGDTNNVYIYYGIVKYNTYSIASQNLFLEQFTEAPFTATGCVFLGYIISRGGAALLNDTNDAVFIQAGNFRNTAGGGGGTGGLALDDLSDVAITTASNYQILSYDTGIWRNLYVTSGNISSGQIGTFHIAQGAITDGLIASGAITSGMIGAGAVFNNNIASGGVVSGKLADGSVYNNVIASGGIGSGKLGNESIVSGSIASGSIGLVHLASGTVFSGTFVVSGSVQSGSLGNAAVVSGSIASGQISVNHLASGVLTAGLTSGIITSGLIGNAAVVSGSIASGSISGPHLASGVINAVSGNVAITSGSLSVNTIFATSGNVGVGTDLTLRAANAVTSGAGGNIILQPGGQSVTGGDGSVYIYRPTGVGGYYLQLACLSTEATARIYTGNHDLTVSTLTMDAILGNGLRIRNATGGSIQITKNDFSAYANISLGTKGVMKLTSDTGYTKGGSIAYAGTTTSVNTNTNNLSLDGSAFQRIDVTSGSTITGLSFPSGGAHVDGRFIRLANVGTQNLTLSNQDALSSGNNRFYNYTSGNIVLGPNRFVDAVYDSTTGGWRVYGDNYPYVLPIVNGTSGQLLTTNGVNNLAWANGFALTSGSVTSGYIGDNAVVSGSIASGQIGSIHLTDGAVLSGDISSGQIGLYHLASGTVLSGTFLLSGNVTSGYLGNNSVNSGNITAGTIRDIHIASGGFLSGSIASGIIGSVHLADGAVQSGDISSGQIGQFHHASGSVTSGHIGNAAVVSGSIASGSVSNFHLSSGSAIANIQSGSIGSGLLANASVVSGNIGSGQIGSIHLADGSVQSGDISSGQIGRMHLSSGAVNSGHLAANSVVSGNIASGTITGGSSGQVQINNGAALTGSSSLTWDGTILSANLLTVTNSAGDEGGEILLAKAQTNTTLSGTGVTIDLYQDRLRFFEQGGNARGFYLQITSGGGGVGTNIMGGGAVVLQSGQVQSGFIGNAAVVSGSIASGQIGTNHIASGVLSAGLTSGSVTSGFIGNAAVVSGSIASGQIGQFHFSSGSITKFTSSASAPSSPSEGDRWYYTTDGILLTYVNDGSSSQWVQF